MKLSDLIIVVIASLFLLGACEEKIATDKGMFIKKEFFGNTPDLIPVDLYTLINTNGMKVKIITYGAIVQSLEVPDSEGNLEDIVLGYDTLEEYVTNNPYFGCIVGRYGNRIGKGKFTLDGKEYTLAKNNGENHLHGGIKGFDKVVWKGERVVDTKSVGVKLTYYSPDGEEGYPGNLTTSLTYKITNDNELILEYHATTDKKTVVNLTHHGYFNLSGQGGETILDHKLMFNADKFTPVDAGLITTGELRDVKGTPFDFTEATKIGARIDADNQQLKYGGGYDHNWVLNREGDGLELAARLTEETSGRVMEIYTTEPGIQFYCGNFLDGTITGKEDRVYKYRSVAVLETQHYPDSPNRPEFPSVELNPDEVYETQTIYKFSTE